MKALLALALPLAATLAFSQTNPPEKKEDAIDWARARTLHERAQRGEKLTAEDSAYYERAKAERAKPQPGGGQFTPKESTELLPLTDLGAEARHRGEDGGLYGGGRNEPTAEHRKLAEAALAKIRPLDITGKPDAAGKIVFVALSMSNATMEFSAFKRTADADARKSPNVLIVDCAQGGQAMAEWAPADARPWAEAKRRIAAAGATPEQVQVAWVKLANKGPRGPLEEHGRKLEKDTESLLRNARALFPNLRVAYLGSRTYGGFAVNALNPEPYAYESAFAARWLIQRQAAGRLEKEPVLLWGPYLWANGVKGRKTDGLVWERADFTGDGVHPSESGRAKVAKLLLDFFTGDSLAKGWFAR